MVKVDLSHSRGSSHCENSFSNYLLISTEAIYVYLFESSVSYLGGFVSGTKITCYLMPVKNIYLNVKLKQAKLKLSVKSVEIHQLILIALKLFSINRFRKPLCKTINVKQFESGFHGICLPALARIPSVFHLTLLL